ncbi:hypothetical protein FRC02_002906 [Tulasnella sp. 418]|nr:hypothetical protein FRC02_002906 [Tulasnella sp. 418]
MKVKDWSSMIDSTASANDWRVVLNALSQSERAGMSVPRFEELRHAAIQTELKFLYVGLTRARKHIWIWDSSEKAHAMQTFWLRRSLITLCGPNDPIPQIAVESTAADWAKSGRLLFQKRLYIQSAFCFEKAGMDVETAIALAYQRRVEARKIASTHSSYLPAWKLAASSFRQAAAISLKPDEKKGLFSRAAECFLEISDHREAAKSFDDAADYTNAATHYRKAGCFDDALRVIQRHRSEINPTVAERIIRVVKLAYTKSYKFREAEKLFEDPEEYLDFLEDLGLDDLRLQVLENMQRFDEAASLAISRGEIVKGIDLCLRSTSSDSKGTARKALVDALWTKFSLGNTPPAKTETEELMKRAPLVAEGHSEIEMFSAIQAKQVLTLTNLGRRFVDGGNLTQALLALDCALRNPPPLKAENLDKVIRFLEGYQVYGQQVRSLIRLQDSVQKPGIQKLLNFKPLPSVLGEEPHEYVVAPSSILYSYVLQLDANKRNFTADGLVTPQEELRHVIQHCLSYRYNQSLGQLHSLAIDIQALHPCTLFTMFGECHRPRCSQQHADAKEITIEGFTKRVRAHIQIIMLLDGMIPLPNLMESWNKRNLQRIWLDRLFTALHPHTPMLGSLPLLDISAIPEFPAALPVLKSWLEERMFTLNPYPLEKWLRSYMGGVISASLMAFTFDQANARNYARKARCSWSGQGPLIRRTSQRTVVEDCLVWLSSQDNYSLTAGVLSLKHIANTATLPVDINALIHYTERLTTHLIFNYKTNRHGNTTMSLGNITLPRSWIMYGLSQSSPLDNPQRSMILVDAVGDLLDILWRLRDASGNRRESNFIYEEVDLSLVHYNLRSLVVARFCRAITLLGYNITSPGLRSKILYIFRRCPDQKPHELYAEFIQARYWDQLARAIRRTKLDTPNDELCQLVIGSENSGLKAVPGVSPMFFNSKEELIRKMRFEISPVPKPITTTLDPTAKEFIPASLMAQPNNTAPGEEEAIEEETIEPLQEPEPIREALGVKSSEAEIAAANHIYTLYRARAEHRRRQRRANA